MRITCCDRSVCIIIFFGLLVAGLPVWFGCTNSIEPSPEPGRLRLVIQHAPEDTLIEVGTKTMTLGDRDSMEVSIFQGKAYWGEDYWVLYETPETYFAGEKSYNILERNDAGTFNEYPIFDSFLPPADYTAFEFGITSSFLLLTKGYVFGGVGIRVEAIPDSSPILRFNQEFRITENHITEIRLTIRSFQSLERHRDVFRFEPKIDIDSVTESIPF